MSAARKFYSVEFPYNVEIQLSDVAAKVLCGGCSLKLIVEKEGISPLQFVGSSLDSIDDLLSTAVTALNPRCRVRRLKVLRSDGFTTGLVLRRVNDSGGLCLRDETLAAMQSLLPGERMRAVVDLRRFRFQRKRDGHAERAVIGFTILFAGSEARLQNIFPLALRKRLWIRRKAWKARPRCSLANVGTVDSLLPSITATRDARSSFPPPGGDIGVPGIRVRTASGIHPLRVDDEFLSSNTLIFGGTRTGKSTFLHRLTMKLIERGRAVCVVDPHGTLVTAILSALGDQANGRHAIYLDPLRCPLGLNPFEVFRESRREEEVASLLVESVAHTIKEGFGREYWGPRLQYLLGGLVKAVAPLRESNFVDVMELINNPFAGKELGESTSDEQTKHFLLSMLPRAKDEWWMSTIDKIGRIIDNKHARSVLCRRKGNIDLAGCVRSGAAILANLDINNVGADISPLIGAMIIATYWIVASSTRTGATIIVDEAQLFPAELIERIASQGRKFGVNVIFASQSPSRFERRLLASIGSNFSNKMLLRLEEMDARLASEFVGDLDPADIKRLDNLEAVVRSDGRTGNLTVEALSEKEDVVPRFIRAMEAEYSLVDDSFPSPLSSFEGQLFDVLQIVRMAEVQGKQSLSGVEETGALVLMGYGPSEMSTLIERARSMLLVQKAHLKLTQRGRDEMMRLQGGIMAGGQKHRSMILVLKDVFDSMGLLTYIPKQRLGREQPDLIVKSTGSISSTLLYFEIEVATKHQLDKRRKKVERANRNKAAPVFVFDEEGPVISAVKGGEFRESVFLLLDGSVVRAFTGRGWTDITDARALLSQVDQRDAGGISAVV